MLNGAIRLVLVLLLALATAGCELVGDIFQAGVWVGVVLVALVIGLVVWGFGKVRG
jgi:energy-converting hydrogenase Eha subunit H